MWKVRCWSKNEQIAENGAQENQIWLHLEKGKKASHVSVTPETESIIVQEPKKCSGGAVNDSSSKSAAEEGDDVSSQERPLSSQEGGSQTLTHPSSTPTPLLIVRGTPPVITIDCQLYDEQPHKDDSTQSSTTCMETSSKLLPQRSSSAYCPLLFGGLEIISQARMIEAYGINIEGKESYITTCRGISSSEHNNNNSDPSKKKWYSTVLVIPGGPRKLKCVTLKLLGSSTDKKTSIAASSSQQSNAQQHENHSTPVEEENKATSVSILSLKVKGRILEEEGVMGDSQSDNAHSATAKTNNASKNSAKNFLSPTVAAGGSQSTLHLPPFGVGTSHLSNTSSFTAPNDIQSAIQAFALIAKSMESSIQTSLHKMEQRLDNIEQQVQNLQTHIQMSHQSSMQHRLQLVQWQNQYLIQHINKSFDEMKKASIPMPPTSASEPASNSKSPPVDGGAARSDDKDDQFTSSAAHEEKDKRGEDHVEMARPISETTMSSGEDNVRSEMPNNHPHDHLEGSRQVNENVEEGGSQNEGPCDEKVNDEEQATLCDEGQKCSTGSTNGQHVTPCDKIEGIMHDLCDEEPESNDQNVTPCIEEEGKEVNQNVASSEQEVSQSGQPAVLASCHDEEAKDDQQVTSQE